MKILQILYMSMKFPAKNLTLSMAFFVVKWVAFSQEKEVMEALTTDRPDQTESANLVPKGFLQLETGAAYESFNNYSIKTEYVTYNTTLVRYGLLNNLELRLGWDFAETKMNSQNPKDKLSGFNPLLLGIKTSIAKEKDWFPEIALLGHLYLPFMAGSDYKPNTTGIDFRFAFAHTLSEKSSLSYNLGATWGNDSPEASYAYTIAYGHSLNKKIGAYIEIYGDLPENSKAKHLWDAGFTYLISNNFQLDATVGTSITKGPDLLLSAGESFRIPTKKK